MVKEAQSPGRFDKFTDSARRVLSVAFMLALDQMSPSIEVSHLVVGLARQGVGGLSVEVLKALVPSLETFKMRSSTELGERREFTYLAGTDMQVSDKVKRIIEQSKQEAANLGHNYVGNEHMLLATLSLADGEEPMFFATFGLTYEVVKTKILEMLGSAQTTDVEAN